MLWVVGVVGVGGVPRPTRVWGLKCRGTLGGLTVASVSCRKCADRGCQKPGWGGAVEPDERVTAATVGTVGVPIVVGCGAGWATKVAVLAEAGGWSESPERKEAWRCFSAASAAAGERPWASMAATRAWHSSSLVWAVVRWPWRTESLEIRGAPTRSCSAVPRSIAWRSGSVAAEVSADTRVRASPSPTSWRETCPTSARC